jgi:peptidase E
MQPTTATSPKSKKQPKPSLTKMQQQFFFYHTKIFLDKYSRRRLRVNFFKPENLKRCMPKIYLLGGENTHRRDAEKINQRAFNDAGEAPKILVFSWARASFDNTYAKSKIIFDYFRSLGASTINTVSYSSTNSEIKDKITQSDLVYLTGGVPSMLIERLKKLCVDSLLREFNSVIVGRSAGALALCSKCVITYRSTSEVKVIDGLGLVDLTLKAHYKLGWDRELIELSKTEDIFAVPKGSALVYDKGNLSAINHVYLFHKGQRQIFS